MAALSFAGFCANTMPRSRRNARQLVDHRRTTRDQPVLKTMDRLQIQLVIGLDRDKAHVPALDGLSDRLRVDDVVLVRLHEGFTN